MSNPFNPDNQIVIEVNGKQTFTTKWIMEQFRALSDLHEYNKSRITICCVITGLSVLLSLVAIVIAVMR